ncbi:HHE domain protein [Rasamsonia emersonii CBS 393.64]|uniref:HHE domain protein n=1 Tax=Rasamsonia emersonii (strain ATCC 16479 / CBS 393.64 / IMI 116815) TaxID=1408163 RepID=A0A0F4YZS4_RASE3|nr:HHE domain protein [Rasamsonia emersonii CBS 393.64]KKA23739.1 HHE domain protein [Rasamsonia emersonii CBS 393.64]
MSSRILDTIKRDHREIEACYDRIIKSTDPDEQTRFQNQFTWELARHAVGEELVLYPALEKHLPDGHELAEKDRNESQTNMSCSDPQFLPTIRALMDDLSQHLKEEETNDVPKLDNALSWQESNRLARSFDRTKMFVPTRSHPGAPNRPPFETAVALLTAPIDRLADIFRKWPDEEMYEPEPSDGMS